MSTSLSLTPPSGLDPLILVQKTNPIALSVFLISLISVVTIFFFSLEAAKPEENQKHLCSLSKDRGWITGDATAEPVDFCVLFLLCKEEKKHHLLHTVQWQQGKLFHWHKWRKHSNPKFYPYKINGKSLTYFTL